MKKCLVGRVTYTVNQSRPAAESAPRPGDTRDLGVPVLRKSFIVAVVAVALIATSVAGVSAPATASDSYSYIPKSGPAFNNPYGKPGQVRKLISSLNRTIDSVPKKQKIRIASWNVRSGNIVSALVRAHRRRKISVQVVMDRHNHNAAVPNADVDRLIAGLKIGNKKRPPAMKSWVRKCAGSCRGRSGIAHTKFFLFSKVRKTKDGRSQVANDVVMYGSYNATELGATIQWNDLYTIKNDRPRYVTFRNVFDQMAEKKPVKQGLVTYSDGVTSNSFYPFTGTGSNGDPVMDTLNAVSCTGAATPSGRTKIRIVQTSIRADRGIVIARKLAQMKKAGCNIRIVYAMNGGQVMKILRNAGVPVTHLAYDSNGDMIYDRYVHMKSMTINGHFEGNPAAAVTFNGSANWTPVALASDEVLGRIDKKGVTRRYRQWSDYLFTHRPESWDRPDIEGGTVTERRAANEAADQAYAEMVESRARAAGIDPYALIKEEN